MHGYEFIAVAMGVFEGRQALGWRSRRSWVTKATITTSMPMSQQAKDIEFWVREVSQVFATMSPEQSDQPDAREKPARG